MVLNGYFLNTKNSKIGILTNGIIWKFYTPNDVNKEIGLFPIPFIELNFSEINEANLPENPSEWVATPTANIIFSPKVIKRKVES